jgi:hypothetical protein
VAQSHPVNDNPTFEEARSGPDAQAWKAAMLEELRSIEENEVWEMAELPLDQRALGWKWVLTVKRDAQGNFQRFKARLVVQGLSQEFGFDYDETRPTHLSFDRQRQINFRDGGVLL